MEQLAVMTDKRIEPNLLAACRRGEREAFESLFGGFPPKQNQHGPAQRPTVVGPGQPTPGTAPQPNPQPA